MNRMHLTTLLGAAAQLTPIALAGDPDFTVTIVALEGNPMPDGDGTIGLVNDVSVNDNGDWIADVNVTSGSVSRALIRNGKVWVKPGDPIDPNDTVTSVANALKHMNSQGDVAWRPGLDANHSGMYLNFTPLILRDDISNSPAFAPGTQYAGIFRGRVTDDQQVAMIATLSEPVLGTIRAIVRLSEDGAGGVSEDVLIKQHDDAPGAEPGVTINTIATNAANFAVSDKGEVLWTSSLSGAPTETNGAAYFDHNLVVRKGNPSPIEGSAYANIGSSSTRLDLSNNGDYLFLSTLTNQPSGANSALIRNNLFTDGPDQIVIKQGDIAPDLDGVRTIDHLGSGVQPFVTDSGEAVWYARFSGNSATNQGLYAQFRLILQKGVTTIDGLLLDSICGTTATSNGIANSLMASPNGRFIILRNRFSTGERAALLVEFDDTGAPCPGDLTGSGSVGVPDLLDLLACWGAVTPGCEDADLTGDKSIGVPDLLDLLAQWGPCP